MTNRLAEALPKPLVDAVAEGRAILFLGAGASRGAVHARGLDVPDGNKLRDMICDRFLNNEMKSASLLECSDFAIDSHDLGTFQQFIRDTFIDYHPAPFHKLLPSFNWAAIFTTNFDLITERSYENQTHSLVTYIKNGQKIDLELRKKSDSILFTKLHGSIDHYMDFEIPLILSSDQYVSFAKNRNMLFDRLLTLGSQLPIIFVGYRASDLHIKKIFSELDQFGQRRPRYFYVGPNIGQYQRSYLDSRRTTCVDATFESFLEALEERIPSKLRSLKIDLDRTIAPMRKHLRVKDPKPSGDLASFLTDDVDYIFSTMPIPDGNDADFYEGIPQGFYAIAKDLDVRRSAKIDTILADVFLKDGAEAASNSVELCVVKGAAGAGKSVFLRRLAWEATTTFDCLCLFHRRTGSLRFSPIDELYGLTGNRIFLFVDRAAYHVDELETLLLNAKSRKVPLTLIVAERHNEWNARCDRLDRHVQYEEELSRLSSNEVEELISKLRTAGALGQLSDKTNSECKEIIEQKLDRQILVALHEATKGKSFEEIVIDEYNRIIPIEAQLLYLDVCTIQRLGADLRAGLLSRIGGVSFEEFRERLLHPLEKVVFVSKDQYSKDHLYRARHQLIAEIVFENVLRTQKQKFDALLRLMKGMNRDYASDSDAFETLMHGSTLKAIFSNADLARELFDEGVALGGDIGFILHQRAAFEVQHSDGDLKIALEAIEKALTLAPTDKARLNTKANILRRQALETSNEIRQTHLRSEAIRVLNLIDNKGQRDFVLALNIHIDELNDLLRAPSRGDLSQRAIAENIQHIEKSFATVKSKFEADPYVLQAESRYRELIKQDARAFSALKRAYNLNRSLTHIALRLARALYDRGEASEAISVLTDTLARAPSKELRFEFARLLSDLPDGNRSEEIERLLERSFDPDDHQVLPRLFLLREYWSRCQNEKFWHLQKDLRQMEAPRQLKLEPNLVIKLDGRPAIFTGRVRRKEADYCFIAPDGGYADVFLHRRHAKSLDFDSISVDSRISFSVGFSVRGATGFVDTD
ncbi:SIR2 family protein [Bradyrhizobium sp. SZCCHNR2028]|uniref:P-loop NTPase n=1 Tax=Bradyrhizobium sp. SZCCHNR2028 TaxID=3057382 RepID=UPI0028E38F2E|nr:SIR2 family protein [Bradyrhizobium sp. SZCCHNR2028]